MFVARIIIIACTLIVTSQLVSSQRRRHRNTEWFSIHPSHMLWARALFRLKGATPEQCASECIAMRGRCLSFDFHRRTMSCFGRAYGDDVMRRGNRPHVSRNRHYDFYVSSWDRIHAALKGQTPDNARDRITTTPFPATRPTRRYHGLPTRRPRPTRPYVRPTRPTRPYVRPTRPYIRPTRPTRPYIRPTRPYTRYTRPITRPTSPQTRYTRPTRPITRPTRPHSRPTRPYSRPTRPTRPYTRYTRPITRPTRPHTRPTRPSIPPATEVCKVPLIKGIDDGQFSASSHYWQYTPQRARLDTESAWMANENNQGQYLQINLGREIPLVAIGTQGFYYFFMENFVKTYTISYDTVMSNGRFTPYEEVRGKTKVFQANKDASNEVINYFRRPLRARSIRIHPVTSQKNIVLRVELYRAC